MDREALIQRGIEIWKSLFRDIDGSDHLVLLSGGHDSRAILGGLLAAGHRDKLRLASFGSPGAWDYEIPAEIAAALNLSIVRHELPGDTINRELLRQCAARLGGWTFLFDAHINELPFVDAGEGAVIWSGFMGGEIAGGHLPVEPSSTWAAARRGFSDGNQFIRMLRLTEPGFDPASMLPSEPLESPELVSYDEQLDYGVRQMDYIGPTLRSPSHRVEQPFVSSVWVQFLLSLPRELRVGKWLYLRMLAEGFPDVFSLPRNFWYPYRPESSRLQSLLGRGMGRVRRRFRANHPVWNALRIYSQLKSIDYDRVLRTRDDYATLVDEAVRNLERQDVVPWLEVTKMWNRHRSGVADCGSALFLFTALDINLEYANHSSQESSRTDKK